jgi:hypothetical protein
MKDAMRKTAGWDRLDASMKESLEMVAHKVGRILNGDPTYADSWHDIAGYVKLVEDQLNAPGAKDEAPTRPLAPPSPASASRVGPAPAAPSAPSVPQSASAAVPQAQAQPLPLRPAPAAPAGGPLPPAGGPVSQ